jgi:hypothetical protein
MDMEMEEDTQPYQPCRNASFFSGLWQSPQIPTLLMGKSKKRVAGCLVQFTYRK